MAPRAVIVDDEQHAINYLSDLLNDLGVIELIGAAKNFDDALKMIVEKRPDLVFMDIQLDGRSGIEVVDELYRIDVRPYIVFVTAYDKHAIDAFRQNALDYLLKPVSKSELKDSIMKFREIKQKEDYYRKLNDLLNMKRGIRFNTRSGFIILNPQDIFYCKANGNYSEIVHTGGRTEMVSLNLGKVEEILPGAMFKRINKSYLVNSSFIYRVERNKRLCLLRSGAHEVELEVSRSRLKELSEEL